MTCLANGTLSNETYYNFGQLFSMFGSGVIIVPLIAILENIAIASAFSQGKAIDATQVIKLVVIIVCVLCDVL